MESFLQKLAPSKLFSSVFLSEASELTGADGSIQHHADTAAAIGAMGGEHLECPVTEARVDADKKMVTTPAYMLAGSVSEAYAGIGDCVKEVLALA